MKKQQGQANQGRNQQEQQNPDQQDQQINQENQPGVRHGNIWPSQKEQEQQGGKERQQGQ